MKQSTKFTNKQLKNPPNEEVYIKNCQEIHMNGTDKGNTAFTRVNEDRKYPTKMNNDDLSVPLDRSETLLFLQCCMQAFGLVCNLMASLWISRWRLPSFAHRSS